jgi:hypothetical protein
LLTDNGSNRHLRFPHFDLASREHSGQLNAHSRMVLGIIIFADKTFSYLSKFTNRYFQLFACECKPDVLCDDAETYTASS